MPRGRVKKLVAPARQSADACLFCKSEEDNEEIYGKLLKKQDITIHYFCMLFSSGLWQRGKRDRDGILGFMPEDICREHKRGTRLTCQYCRKKGATIGCVISNCRKTFHFRCGREAGGLSQFFQQFRSYCPDHRPCQETPTSDRLAFYGTAKSTCSICMLSVDARASNDTLRSPCCRKAWFHRNCIQRYALSAGAYFFKCPLCNNKELFEAEMLEFGIYIPEQDAAWEQDPSAFQELLERYNRCDATACLCSQGREHSGPLGSRWELILCDCCGSSGSHAECQGLTKVNKEILCRECAEITAMVKNQKTTKKGSAQSKATTPSQEQISRQLRQRLSASLRAERAARRQAASSPDSSPVTLPPRKGHKPRGTESSSGAPAELPTQGAAAPQVLNKCSANGLPVVFVAQAKVESGIKGTEYAEDTSETSDHQMVQLSGSDSPSPAVPNLVSSNSQVRRASPRKRSALAQASTPVKMSSDCAEETGDPPNAKIRPLPDLSTALRKRSVSGRQASAPQDVLPANVKQSPVKCTAVVESSLQCAPMSPRKTPSKVTARDEKDGKNPAAAALVLPGPSQLTQNMPSHIQHVSSPQVTEPHATDIEMDLDTEHNADACQASQQTAQTLNNSMEEDELRGSNKSCQKRGRKGGSEVCKNNLDKFYQRTVVNTTNDQCITRTQSFVCKRWTRSSLAQSKPLKRNGVSLDQEVLNWRLVKEPETSACEEKLKKLSKKSPRRRCVQYLKYRSRPRKRKRNRKLGHTKTCQAFLKGKLFEPGSDGNNNFSDEAEEMNHQQPECKSPGQLWRMTQSGFSQGPFFLPHPDRTNSSLLLSDAVDCPQSLPVPDQDSTKMSTKDHVQKDVMTTAKDASSSMGVLGSSQVRYMDRLVRSPSQGFASVVESNVADLAKALLSTEAGEVQSSSSCDMPLSGVVRSSRHLEDDFMSLLTQSAVLCEERRRPSMNLFLPVGQGFNLADSEAISIRSLLVRRKQKRWLAKKKKKKRKIITSRSPQKRSAGVAVCVEEENPVSDVASFQEWPHSMASLPQQGIGHLFMLPVFESPPTVPHSFRSESLVQRSAAYQVSLSQSPDHPDQVLLWNVQSQKPGATAAAATAYQPHAAEAFETVMHRARTVFTPVST